MRKFENVDIINSLRRIMNINTEHYKNDFFLDVDTIQEDTQSVTIRKLARPSSKMSSARRKQR